MPLSLTPEVASDLNCPLVSHLVDRAVREHGLDPVDFWNERKPPATKPVTLRELRDWLGY